MLEKMTQYTHADLEMADRHIALGEQHIAGQEVLLTRLRMQASPTEEAEDLLSIFNATQVEHRTHRAAIVAALEAAGVGSSPGT